MRMYGSFGKAVEQCNVYGLVGLEVEDSFFLCGEAVSDVQLHNAEQVVIVGHRAQRSSLHCQTKPSQTPQDN